MITSKENIEIQRLVSKKYESFSLDEKVLLHKLYHEDVSELDEQLKKVVFRLSPPTPEEFLDYRNEWITRAFADSLYPHVVDDFLQITNKDKNYIQAVEYGATRLGKSYLARLVVMYTMIYVHCLRQPQLYYGLSPTTSLSIYFMCFNVEKVKQLLLKPIYSFLSNSPRFKQIKFQDIT